MEAPRSEHMIAPTPILSPRSDLSDAETEEGTEGSSTAGSSGRFHTPNHSQHRISLAQAEHGDGDTEGDDGHKLVVDDGRTVNDAGVGDSRDGAIPIALRNDDTRPSDGHGSVENDKASTDASFERLGLASRTAEPTPDGDRPGCGESPDMGPSAPSARLVAGNGKSLGVGTCPLQGAGSQDKGALRAPSIASSLVSSYLSTDDESEDEASPAKPSPSPERPGFNKGDDPGLSWAEGYQSRQRRAAKKQRALLKMAKRLRKENTALKETVKRQATNTHMNTQLGSRRSSFQVARGAPTAEEVEAAVSAFVLSQQNRGLIGERGASEPVASPEPVRLVENVTASPAEVEQSVNVPGSATAGIEGTILGVTDIRVLQSLVFRTIARQQALERVLQAQVEERRGLLVQSLRMREQRDEYRAEVESLATQLDEAARLRERLERDASEREVLIARMEDELLGGGEYVGDGKHHHGGHSQMASRVATNANVSRMHSALNGYEFPSGGQAGSTLGCNEGGYMDSRPPIPQLPTQQLPRSVSPRGQLISSARGVSPFVRNASAMASAMAAGATPQPSARSRAALGVSPVRAKTPPSSRIGGKGVGVTTATRPGIARQPSTVRTPTPTRGGTTSALGSSRVPPPTAHVRGGRVAALDHDAETSSDVPLRHRSPRPLATVSTPTSLTSPVAVTSAKRTLTGSSTRAALATSPLHRPRTNPAAATAAGARSGSAVRKGPSVGTTMSAGARTASPPPTAQQGSVGMTKEKALRNALASSGYGNSGAEAYARRRSTTPVEWKQKR